MEMDGMVGRDNKYALPCHAPLLKRLQEDSNPGVNFGQAPYLLVGAPPIFMPGRVRLGKMDELERIKQKRAGNFILPIRRGFAG
jgi:hypothetical protein